MDPAALEQVCKLADKGRALYETIASLEAKKKDVARGTTYLTVEFSDADTLRLPLANIASGPRDVVMIGRLQSAICKVLDEWITELRKELDDL